MAVRGGSIDCFTHLAVSSICIMVSIYRAMNHGTSDSERAMPMEILRVCANCALRRSFTRYPRQRIRVSFQHVKSAEDILCSRARLTRWMSSSTTLNSKFSGKTTVDEDEVIKLSRSGSDWWDTTCGEFSALHAMNRQRVPFIKKSMLRQQSREVNLAAPLKGLKILDVGCGGGILSEPLARLGGKVTGIDASARNTHVAMRHASHDPMLASNLHYECLTVEELAEREEEVFDCVVSSEVIEHVTEKQSFIEAISHLLKAGGSLVLTTLNRTTQSYLLAIIGAEYVTHIVAPGTHDWYKFVTINELRDLLRSNCLEVKEIQGMAYNPLTNCWCKTSDTNVNFAIHAVKGREDVPII